MMVVSASLDAPISPRAAFEHRDFRLFQLARLISVLGTQMLSVAVAWQVYQITHRALDLGYVGLAQFFPAFLLSIPAGHAADRFDRRKLVMLCNLSMAVWSTLLLIHSLQRTPSVRVIFSILMLMGVTRAFVGPASQSLMPQLVPEKHFQNAVAWSSSIFQIATIAGPALGGLVYGLGRGAALVYACSIVAYCVTVALQAALHVRTGRMETAATSLDTVLAGVRYVWKQKVILGSITLDLFAVLLGGAVALLPIYANDILRVGPVGLGLLRSAPAVGAAITAAWVAHRPLRKRSGAVMFCSVAVFGLATIAFGISRNLGLSLAALFVVGASDMVSVIIRGTLVQLTTPPAMRGRVSAVNFLFIGTSNEFGEFESGITAQWWGAVRAVVIGGIGTLAVVAVSAWKFPELRRVDSLAAAKQDPEPGRIEIRDSSHHPVI